MPETFNYDNLIAGDNVFLVTEPVTILAGQNLARGALLGRITASGKYISSLSAAADGSQTPTAILAETIDATAADKAAIVYLAGEFNENKVLFGTGHTIASTKAGLRDNNIYLKSAVPA